MLSILVAHSYFLRFDRKQRERCKPYPPLATLHVAAMLRRAGHSVAVFDAMLADGVDDFATQLGNVAPRVVLFYEDSFNFLSKMCLGRMRQACQQMIAPARQAGARVIVVGSDATDAPEAYLQAGAEVVVQGEGLVSLFALLARLDQDAGIAVEEWIEGLSGVAVHTGGRVRIEHGARALPNPLYSDHPAWDLIDLDRYRLVWQQAHGYFSLNMAASRGCSFRCNWCSKPIWGNQYLQRAPRDVAAEMAQLKRNVRPDHVWFADDIFGFRVDWVREFGDTLHQCGGVIPYTIQSRADLISEEMAQALSAAGCVEVWLGAESGSQRILDAMNKGTRVAEIIAARERLGRHGIRVGFFIQLGYLGEQLEDLLATRVLLAATTPDDVGVSVSYPLPGTRFYEMVKRQLGRKTHWEESNDLEMMFEGTYRSVFYRAFRNLLHDQVEIDRPGSTSSSGSREELERRWCDLLEREGEFRTRNGGAEACTDAADSVAAAGALPISGALSLAG
jgi:anaerobic magnesium-protoporphyrin IX monomethyl ester cyclase